MEDAINEIEEFSTSVDQSIKTESNNIKLEPHRLESSLFEFSPKKFHALFGNPDNAEPLAINGDVTITAKRPQYLSSITFYAVSKSNLSKLQLRYVSSMDGRSQRVEGKVSEIDKSVTFEIGTFVSMLEFKLESSYLKKSFLQLMYIDPLGYDFRIEHREEIIQAASIKLVKLESLQSESNQTLAQIQAEKKQLEQEKSERASNIQSATATLESIKNQTESQRQELSKLTGQVAPKQKEISSFEAKISELSAKLVGMDTILLEKQNSIQSLTKEGQEKTFELEQKSKLIIEKKDKLESLNRDISLFAVDMKGYGWQGIRQIALYVLLLGGVLLLGHEFASYSLKHANEVWTVYQSRPKIMDVWVLAGIKLPFIFLAAAILTGLSTLAFTLIKKIFETNDKRLWLSEISVIAKDLSDTCLHGAGLNPEEKHAVFLATRMNLIKEYLSGRLSKERKLRAYKGNKDFDSDEMPDLAWAQSIIRANFKTTGKKTEISH
jgi:hypothetical protein